MFQPLDYLFILIILGCLMYSSLQFYLNYVKVNKDTNDEEMIQKYLKVVALRAKGKRI